MSNFKKIFQQTFWQIAGKIITSLSTFIILGLVTRNYGKEGTGVFTLALTYLSMFYLVADFGFNAYVLSRVKGAGFRVQEEWNKLLGTRLIWSMLLVGVAVGLLPFWPFSTPVFIKAVLFGGFAIVASSVFVTCNLIFQGKLRYDLSTLASGLGTVIGLVVFVLLSANKFSIPFLLIAHLISWIAIAGIALFLTKKLYQQISPVFDLAYEKNLFKKSWPIAATLSLNVLYFRADSFMIAYFKSISDVGIYNVAYSVFQGALVLPTFIMNAYYPMLLKSFNGVNRILLGLLGLSLIGTFTILIFGRVIIEILTGGGFNGSTQSLQILSLGFPAYFVSALFMWILVAKGRYKSMFLLYTSGLFLNLILNYIYIPQYSYIAASWTTVISEYFILGIQVVVLVLKRK
ncbi:MAG: flippase [Candidatus Daviesbacteria bacterium]|nr:flippase [Candidatus Daviesbacteria bacterium]